MSQSVLEMTTNLVLAQIQAGSLSPEDVQNAIRHIYQNLLTLKTMEEASFVSAPVAESPQTPVDWRKSVSRNTINCLECGVLLKQLPGLHLRLHGLDARTYRLKYGIPQNQPLAAREAAAKQREMLQRIRPWELSPVYIHSQERRAEEAAKVAEAPKSKHTPRSGKTTRKLSE